MTKVTYPSGRAVDYAYDDRGQLETVDWDGSTIETIGYDDLGRLTSVDRPFVDESRTYDAGGRLTAVNNTNVGNASYTYDANGNKQSESWTGVMSGWNFTTTNTGTYPSGYDDEDRFRNFVQSAKSVDLFLDRSDIGNITNYKLGTTDGFRSYSNTHELTTIDGTSQTFDVDGQLTDSHTGIELDWDEAGMLSSTVVSSGDTAGIEGTNEYGYDARQKRAWKKITRSGSVAEHTVFIYAGPNCIAEYASGTAAASPSQEYVYGQGVDSLKMIVRSGGSQKLTITRNQQWSISALADHSNGTVLERYTYDAFGKRTILAADGSTVRTASSYDNPYGYTSRRHDDESGLMYFRARYYDTETGEFGSLDPLGYVNGMSNYRGYMLRQWIDPFGLKCEPPTKLGANLIGGRGSFQMLRFGESGKTVGPYPQPDPNKNILVPMWVEVEWLADAASFKDENDCCCCDKINWVQIMKFRKTYAGAGSFFPNTLRNQRGWQVDGGIPYPGAGSRGFNKFGKPCFGDTIGFADEPEADKGNSVAWLTHYEASFEMCVYCSKGVEASKHMEWQLTSPLSAISGHKLTVYACAKWGFSMTLQSNGEWKTNYLRRPKEVEPNYAAWREATTKESSQTAGN